ncbi:MAG: D-alanyl-D-alanine carboxypeptidase [Mogibacterium sp.]|nr:D-alanyl-D-alanine carboxypeptidase [Mogibacterium sp.]
MMKEKRRDILTIRLISLMIAMILVWGSIPVYGAVREDAEAPKIDSKAAALWSATTDEMIYTKEPDKKVQPYSTTKLLTALLAAENLDLKQKVTVPKEAAEIGESTMWLEEGEVVTVEQLLYGTLIVSGNDAAYTLGIATGGDYKTFVQMMNDKAAALGCTGTHFSNPHGFQAEDHYTTAADFLLIARAAFENETVRKIAGTTKYEMPATNLSSEWTMETHTALLEDKDSGVISGKTGYWEDDDCSIALDYDKDGLAMVLVLFGSQYETRTKDVKKLLAYGRDAIVTYEAVTAGTACGEIRVRHGAENRVDVLPAETVPAYPKNGQESEISVKVQRTSGLVAPITEGQEVGTITIEVDGKEIAEVAALAAADVKVGWFPSYFYISNRQSVILGCVLLVLILLALWIRNRRKHKKERIAAKRAVYQKRAAEKRARREALATEDLPAAEEGPADEPESVPEAADPAQISSGSPDRDAVYQETPEKPEDRYL